MRTIHAGSCTATDEKGGSMKMDYYITIKEAGIEGFCLESYGIRIEQERSGKRSAAQIDDVTCNAREIDLLAQTVCKGAVTPVSLLDVINDWI